jgi:hypothetical protein
MRTIMYSLPDGQVCITTPVRNTIGERLTTDEEIEQRAWNKLPKDAINPVFLPDNFVSPVDRTFRDAWKRDLSVDMGKAVEIHKTTLRDLRAPKLAALDVEFIKAVEVGDAKKQKDISDKKQALRDVTSDPRITAAQTPEELKAVIPDALK